MADTSDPPPGTPWTNKRPETGQSPGDLYSELKKAVASGGGPSNPGTPLPGDTVIIVDGGEEG